MNKILFVLLFFALTAFAQQTTVAVLPSEGASLSSNELEMLTDKMREAALKVLPTNAFVLLKQDVVVKRLGGAENYIKECKESSCIVDLGKKAQVDYVAQASVGKLDNEMRLKVELYNVRTEGLVGIFNDEAENLKGLLVIVEKKVPEVFSKIPGASSGKALSPTFAGGIGGVQIAGGNYEFAGEKSYLVNIATEPQGAVLSFNGMPNSRCTKTPCRAELSEGSVRIIANLEQYEIGDTTVSIKQNNQSINIRLKANFGVLEIKPAYLDGIGNGERWSLTINDKAYYSMENRLNPGKYEVELSHECYEIIRLEEVGINKNKREVFNMASQKINLKMGGLALRAEQDSEPVSEPVFVNGKQVGETPFSGTVPVCANIEVGSSREKVNVVLKHNENVTYTYKIQEQHDSYDFSFLDKPNTYPVTPATAMNNSKTACKTETDKVKSIYGKCVKMGKATSSYAKCVEDYKNQKEKAGQACNSNTYKTKEPAKSSEEQEKMRTAWMGGWFFGGGVSLNMDDIDPNYFKSLSGQFNANVEFFKQNSPFFHFGFNFDGGALGVNTDMVRKEYPNVLADRDSMTAYHVKVNAFARLYPVSFLFLSGGVGYEWYSIMGQEGSGGDKIDIMNIKTPVFPVGGGICLCSYAVAKEIFLSSSASEKFTPVGVAIEALYNIVPFKGRIAKYISINAGLIIGGKW
ncbi:MAG: PEGA domain-containing protein [Fibromonadaceae bacterium]|jgi:hypothetical protein|nr:PEGA domain-containing protein [Fibromonadaceae bacterium]